MAEETGNKDPGPSLELPSFLGGRRRRRSPEPEPTAPAPQPDRAPTEPERSPVLAPSREPSGRPAHDERRDTEPGDAGPGSRRERRRARLPRSPRLPRLGARAAAAVTGLLVGLVTVALVWLTGQGCDALLGTSSCGGGPGLLLLSVTLALAAVLGSRLLAAWQVPDPTSTSVLAVGLTAVVAMLFLTDALLSPWMLLVVPAVTAAAFLASHWVTTGPAGGR